MMAEESLTGEDKEILRRRLELLQREYERTAQRLQRAERREAVRRHVQNRISHQNRLLQINTPGLSQLSPASPSISNSNLLSNQTPLLETKPDDGFLSSKKLPFVRFHLPDGSDVSPCSTPTGRRSPTHRLRSKRSRLRLQSREKESDTDSQDKAKEGVEERPGEEKEQKRADCDWSNKANHLEMERGEEQGRPDTARGQTEEENSQAGWNAKGSEGEAGEEKLKEVLEDKLRESEGSSDVGVPLCSTAGTSSVNRSPVEVFPVGQVEVKNPLADQSADTSSQSSSTASDQLFMQVPSCQSTGLSKQSDNHKENDTERDKDGMAVLFSSEKTGFLDSCTLIEGLPFPVEYYIRTTRRMAAAHSPVDLDAVIHSQLSKGRGRRKSSFSASQTRGRSHLTSEASQPHGKALDQPRCRGRGRRGRRGRRRTRAVGISRSCTTADFSEVEPESLTETESSTQSPQSQSLLQTSLSGESFPQLETSSQPEPIPTPKPVLNAQPVAADFKHLSDSQLYLNCKLRPDSDVYPIFRRRRGQAEGAVSCSQAQTSTNGNDCRPLLSLASLAQALKVKNWRPLGQLLTTSDIQDFHLPDDEFGQLKLHRLCTSSLNVEPLSPHYSAYNTRRNSRRCSFRKQENMDSSEVQSPETEHFPPEPLPPSAYLEDSFLLSQMSSADQSLMPRKTDQSEKPTKTADQVKPDAGSQKSCLSGIISSEDVNDQETEDCIPLRSVDQLEEEHSQTLPTEDKETPTAYSKELEENAEEHTHDLQTCRQHEHEGNGSPCPAVLNLSMSLTPHMQHGPDSSLPSLGITPHLSTTSPVWTSPSNQSVAPCSSQLAEHAAPAVATISHSPKARQNVCQDTLQTQSQTNKRDLHTPPEPEPANKAWLSPVVKTPLQNVHNAVSTVSENQTKHSFEVENQHQDIKQPERGLHSISQHTETEHHSQTRPEPKPKPEDQSQSRAFSPPQTDSGNVIKPCALDPSASQTADGGMVLALDMADTGHMITEHPVHLVSQVLDADTPCQDQAVEAVLHSDNTISSGTLQRTHTLKALEGGCVLDLCLVRWSSDDWCVCVAGEWSVCVWAKREGVQQWSLIHTWTFTQSVISLQGVPDSPGLLCASLGRLEITEVRILCCPSIDGEFSQAEVCKGALQAVVAASDCRLVCCSAPGAQQKVQVFTLSQDCRVADARTLVSTNRSIQTLATVEREKDALIGWTECKTLLIWNMKSGQLLQTVRLTDTMSTATCLKGYSYKGALCVLFQSEGVCDEEKEAVLFTLIAMNPLTGKNFTLTSVTSPAAARSERLIDGDVCESMQVAGVFQSGHLSIWDLRGGVASVPGGGEAQSCRLARWAGPSTLVTGYLNGDVSVYQFKPTETKTTVINNS
ncbi:uncharacterized protein palb2 [Salminus brasiliensis]|uniref:uncharacterized protein palb2 n=1 Tax=Salminus brasiliensis TaxID=930266 RepID=UPI003B837D45